MEREMKTELKQNRKMKNFSHIKRLNILMKTMLEGKIERIRATVRQWYKWEDNIQMSGGRAAVHQSVHLGQKIERFGGPLQPTFIMEMAPCCVYYRLCYLRINSMPIDLPVHCKERDTCEESFITNQTSNICFISMFICSHY